MSSLWAVDRPDLDARARDREVVELRRAGWRMTEIARELGLSPEWVARIIGRAGGVDRERWLQARSGLHLQEAQRRSREILARWRRGTDPPQVARELGLDQKAVWRVVRELSTEADRIARARTLAGRRGPRFTDAELLDGLQRVATGLGRVPTDCEYDRLAAEMGLASIGTLYQRFDGWRSALRAAGLETQPQRRWSRWDQAACWRALRSVSDQLGDPPRYRRYLELAKQSDDLPSGGIVRRQLGLWSEIAAELARCHPGGQAPARRVAEIRPRVSVPARPVTSFPDERLIAGVRAVADRVGHTPGGREYERLAKPLGLASLPTVYIRFGNWSEALRAAGYEPPAPKRTYHMRWDAAACWQALESIADELGDRPRYSEYQQLASGRDDLPSGALLRQRLGPWSQILAALRERREADESQRNLREGTYAAA